MNTLKNKMFNIIQFLSTEPMPHALGPTRPNRGGESAVWMLVHSLEARRITPKGPPGIPFQVLTRGLVFRPRVSLRNPGSR